MWPIFLVAEDFMGNRDQRRQLPSFYQAGEVRHLHIKCLRQVVHRLVGHQITGYLLKMPRCLQKELSFQFKDTGSHCLPPTLKSGASTEDPALPNSKA